MIASYMIKFLAYLNDNVFERPVHIFALCRSFVKATDKFCDIIGKEYFSLIIQNVTTPVFGIAPDYIFHMASSATPSACNTEPLGIMEANTIGTWHLLALARQKGSRFVYLSSGEVYGIHNRDKSDEDSYGYINLADVRNCYAEAKRCGEMLCVSATHEWNVNTRIIRPFHTYGPGLDLDNDPRVFASFVKNIVRNEAITMRSNGRAVRSFLYLQDFVEGFFTALFRGERGRAYNVAGGGIRIYDLAKLLQADYKNKNLEVIIGKEKNDSYLSSNIWENVADTSELESLGWRQKIFISEGFKRTINYHSKGNETCAL